MTKKFKFFAVSAFVISLAGFVFTPFTGDLYVLFAGSRQAELLTGGGVIERAFRIWDLKGAFYRLFLYLCYKVITIFTALSEQYYYISANILFSLITISVIALSVLLSNGTEKLTRSFYITLALCAGIFASLPMHHIQAEMICALKIILAFGIYLNARRTGRLVSLKLFIAGLVLGSMFFYKSVFALLGVSFTLGVMLWDRERGTNFTLRQFMSLASGGLAMLALGLYLIVKINPGEIQNMLDAAYYQNTLVTGRGFSILRAGYHFTKGLVKVTLTVPIIYLGLSFGLAGLVENILRRDAISLLLRLSIWGIPALVVILANCYFDYHYFIFVPVSMFEIASGYKQKVWTVLKLAFVIPVGVYMMFISVFSANFRDWTALTERVYAQNREAVRTLSLSDEPVMYLDDGMGAYRLGSRTYLPEHYPLPLQRIGGSSPYINLECHTRAMKRALAYQGRYVVVYDSWFFHDDYNREIRNKLNNEYTRLPVKLSRYSILPNIFSRPFIDETSGYDIYERRTD